MKQLPTQLVNDLKASPGKAILLGVLLLVGFYFWIPAALSLFRSGDAATNSPVVAAVTSPQADNSLLEASMASLSEPNGNHTELLRTADASEFTRDPFVLDHDQYPPPVLFSEASLEDFGVDESTTASRESETNPEVVATNDAARLNYGLELKSTVIGSVRRAAMINSKLYFEGQAVPSEAGDITLQAVHPKRVVMRNGQTQFELALKRWDETKE